MEVVPFTPRKEKEDYGIEKVFEEAQKIEWESLHLVGTTPDGDVIIIHSAGSILEFVGILEKAKLEMLS